MEATEAFPQGKMGFDLGFFFFLRRVFHHAGGKKDWEGQGSRTGISGGTRWNLTALQG